MTAKSSDLETFANVGRAMQADIDRILKPQSDPRTLDSGARAEEDQRALSRIASVKEELRAIRERMATLLVAACELYTPEPAPDEDEFADYEWLLEGGLLIQRRQDLVREFDRLVSELRAEEMHVPL